VLWLVCAGDKEVDVWIGCKGMERGFFVFVLFFSGFVFLGGIRKSLKPRFSTKSPMIPCKGPYHQKRRPSMKRDCRVLVK